MVDQATNLVYDRLGTVEKQIGTTPGFILLTRKSCLSKAHFLIVLGRKTHKKIVVVVLTRGTQPKHK